jgi:undecaprenyl-diphosphatase
MSVLHALILGIVEGLTEFLPISSTGHLILASRLLGLPHTDALGSFEIAIQLGAIMAVVALYWRKLLLDRGVLLRVFVAFLPTGVLGLALHSFVKRYLLGNVAVVVWALLAGGVAIIVLEKVLAARPPKGMDLAKAPLGYAFAVGAAQAAAMIPGVSRSAATVMAGLLLGASRTSIVEFSFLLAVPTMLAATGLDMLRSASAFTAADATALVIGSAVSFVVAFAAVRWLIGYVRTHDFTPFGAYRIAVAAAFWLFVL